LASTPFWKARWNDGVSPKELAPNLFKQARFKFRSIHKELKDSRWIKNIKRLDTKPMVTCLTTDLGVHSSGEQSPKVIEQVQGYRYGSYSE
jgi:hypothetical protein